MNRAKPKHSWPLRRLGDVARYINGAAFKPSDWTLDGLPIIRIQNLTDPDAPCNRYAGKLDEKFRVRDGDLLVSWSATLDVFRWERGQAWLNQHIFRVEEDTSLVSRDYLTLAIKHALAELQAQAHGTTMLHIKRGPFEDTQIPVPPLAEQRRLVARIEALTRRLEQARQARQAALAEAEHMLAAAISSLLQRRKHAIVPLQQLLSEQPRNGWSPPAIYQTGNGTPVLTLSSVTGFLYNGSKVKLTSAPTKEGAHYWLHRDELLITRSNTPELVGHAAIYDGTPTKAICCDLIMKMKVNPAKADVRFVHYCLRSPSARQFITQRAKGASGTMQKIAKQDVQEIPIPEIPVAEQRRIVSRLDALSAKQTELRRLQTETEAELAAFTPALLAKAFKGEL
jgi:type I restriction enzyme, S subunit